jgi:hypothetical protein
MLGWEGARRQGCVPYDRLRVRVLVVGVGVDRTFLEQMAEAAFPESIAIAAQQVAT